MPVIEGRDLAHTKIFLKKYFHGLTISTFWFKDAMNSRSGTGQRVFQKELLVVEGCLRWDVVVETGVVALLRILGVDERAHVWL